MAQKEATLQLVNRRIITSMLFPHPNCNTTTRPLHILYPYISKFPTTSFFLSNLFCATLDEAGRYLPPRHTSRLPCAQIALHIRPLVSTHRIPNQWLRVTPISTDRSCPSPDSITASTSNQRCLQVQMLDLELQMCARKRHQARTSSRSSRVQLSKGFRGWMEKARDL
jgi:hypothetical protein